MTEKDYIALTLIGEARGEPIEGIIGVGSVIRNRVHSSHGLNFEKVCLAPEQFSCWNEKDPNFPLLQRLGNDLDQGNPINDPFFRQCIFIASGIFHEDLRDNTIGSKNYVTVARQQMAIARRDNSDLWILKMKKSVVLGNHVFLV